MYPAHPARHTLPEHLSIARASALARASRRQATWRRRPRPPSPPLLAPPSYLPLRSHFSPPESDKPSGQGARGAPPPRTNLPESHDTPPVLTSIYNITPARYPVRRGTSFLLIWYRCEEREF